ncbi:MAG: hypothetical protein V9E83_11485 [Baekduia sp.]
MRDTFTTTTTNPAGDSGGVVGSVTTSGGASGTSLPEGVYTVSGRYYESGSSFQWVDVGPNTGVVIDRTSLPAAVSAPAGGTAVRSQLPVSYSLAEAATSVVLTFSSPGQDDRLVSLNSGWLTSGSHSLTVYPSAIGYGAHVLEIGPDHSSLPDGNWELTVRTTDTLGNDTAESDPVAFSVDTATAAPTLTTPATGQSYAGRMLPVAFSLPEAAQDTSLTVTFTAPGVNRVLTIASNGAGSRTLTVDRDLLQTTPGLAYVFGGGTLPDGTYTVTLAYQDALGNPISQVAATGVALTSAAPPTPDPGPAPAPDPAPDTTPTSPPQTLAPVLPGALNARLTAKRTRAKRWTISATSTTYAGAKRYRLTARRGSRTRSATCKVAKGTVRCSLAVTARGSWTVTVAALDGSGTTLAAGTKRVSAR